MKFSDVLQVTGDEDFREFTRGWYVSQIQQCLEELSFDSFMVVLDDDFEFPENYALALPANTFNVRGIWVYNGAIGDPTEASAETNSLSRMALHKNDILYFLSSNTKSKNTRL